MLVEIDTSQRQLDWGAIGINRVIQNVYNLMTTRVYEVAYDRTLGLKGDFVDMPLNEAISVATSEIYDIIETYEPRATVKSVDCTGAEEQGNLLFKVVIEI